MTSPLRAGPSLREVHVLYARANEIYQEPPLKENPWFYLPTFQRGAGAPVAGSPAPSHSAE